MNRKDFLQALAILPLASSAMKLDTLNQIGGTFGETPSMPVLFLGHGSPMNALEDNVFTRGWRLAGKNIPRPNAILCISAHWETRGTFVTAMEKPKTIHDFGGFPKALFEFEYPAPGSPEVAKTTAELVKSTEVGMDHQWGLDHGAWSVIRHLYPDADVPVLQMSIDYTKPLSYHYQLSKELASLRQKGILIVGSGNIVHNLGLVAWDKLNETNYGFDWALEAKAGMNQLILDGDHGALTNIRSKGKAFELAIPSPEHYIPLLYVLGLKKPDENVDIFNDFSVAGSLTMTSLKIC